MNQKKARARRRAQERSRRNNRWQRKAEGVEASAEQDLRAARLAAITQEREALLASANQAAREAVAAVEANRRDAIKSAWADYDKARAKIIKELAEQEEAAA